MHTDQEGRNAETKSDADALCEQLTVVRRVTEQQFG